MFPPQVIKALKRSCDDRIDKVKDKLDSMKTCEFVLGLVDLEMNEKYVEKIKNYENNIQLIKTEKLLYTFLANPQTEKTMFPLILKKYDELMGISYDLSGNMVISGLNAEGDHLEYCKASLSQREYIKKLCDYGENR